MFFINKKHLIVWTQKKVNDRHKAEGKGIRVLAKIPHLSIVVSLVVLALSGCEQNYAHLDPINDPDLSQKIAEQVEGQKLRQIATQVVPPARNRESTRQVAPQALPYIGRYKVVMSCEDRFAHCEQGTADFMISLLDDGTAHRSIIHLGRITFDSENKYRKDAWSYDADTHQIILHRASGVEFFYDIDVEGNIIMDLDKIAHATETNRKYFEQGHPLPMQAYKLIKIE